MISFYGICASGWVGAWSDAVRRILLCLTQRKSDTDKCTEWQDTFVQQNRDRFMIIMAIIIAWTIILSRKYL